MLASPAVDLKHKIPVSKKSSPSHSPTATAKNDGTVLDKPSAKHESIDKPTKRSSLSDYASVQENFRQLSVKHDLAK